MGPPASITRKNKQRSTFYDLLYKNSFKVSSSCPKKKQTNIIATKLRGFQPTRTRKAPPVKSFFDRIYDEFLMHRIRCRHRGRRNAVASLNPHQAIRGTPSTNCVRIDLAELSAIIKGLKLS